MPRGCGWLLHFTSTTQPQQKGKTQMKEIVLPAFALKEALPGLNKIVSRRSALPVLQSVRIGRDSEGKIHLQATDLDAFATYTAKEPLPGPVVDMLVPLEQLAKTVKTLSSDAIVGFIPEGKDKVKLRYSIGSSTLERIINSLPADEFPPIPEVKQPSMPLEPGFGVALRQALECCSEDSGRRILNGACLDVSDKKFHYIIGTNGRFLFSANSFCFDLKQSIVIPDSKFLEWSDFIDEEPASLSVEPGEEAQEAENGKPAKDAVPGWVKLESGRWTFITKEIEGQYPNWKQVIPTTSSKWTRVVLSDAAVKQLLLVTPSLPGDESINRTVRLQVDRHLIIEGQGKDDGAWTSAPIQDVTVTGKPLCVGLNRKYLLNALKFGLNQLEIEDSLSPVILSNGGKKMVIMPIRIEDQSTQAPSSDSSTVQQPSSEQNATPSNPEPTTEERSEMPRTARATTATAPEAVTRETVTTEVQNNSNNVNGSPIKSLVEQVEAIKENLKAAIRDLTTVVDTVKQAEKEKRVADKEIEAIRTKLRQIQSVSI
jgi:DNA polymerase III sliding clamp (beta) subunit (PCNA family)